MVEQERSRSISIRPTERGSPHVEKLAGGFKRARLVTRTGQ